MMDSYYKYENIVLYMFRHGKTWSNREKRYLGKTDEPLSEEGILELERNKHRYPQLDVLYVSPMRRCIETADILYPGTRQIIIPEWEEIDFGDFEGKNYMELKSDERYIKWVESNATLPFPGGESREDFIKRCLCGYEKMLESLKEKMSEGSGENNNKIKSVGVIAHGGTLMAVLSSLCGGDYFDYHSDNADGYICELCSSEGRYIIKNPRRYNAL